MAATSLSNLLEKMQGNKDLWLMGHGEDQQTGDLGLGWLYYGLTRALRPSLAVVIGSWRGFVPMLIGQALQDCSPDGRLLFIDPSLVDDHWANNVSSYFAGFGIHCITHFKQTSEEFLEKNPLSPGDVDLLFIDGYHSYEQCKLEYEGFGALLSTKALTLFHDSTSRITSGMYGPNAQYKHTVWKYIDELRLKPGIEVLNLDIAQGVAVVQRAQT